MTHNASKTSSGPPLGHAGHWLLSSCSGQRSHRWASVSAALVQLSELSQLVGTLATTMVLEVFGTSQYFWEWLLGRQGESEMSDGLRLLEHYGNLQQDPAQWQLN